MTRPVVVLGATGSIGTQALEVAAHLGLEVAGIAARSPSPALAAAAAGIPDAVVVATGGSADERVALAGELGERARFGTEELIGLAAWPGATGRTPPWRGCAPTCSGCAPRPGRGATRRRWRRGSSRHCEGQHIRS